MLFLRALCCRARLRIVLVNPDIIDDVEESRLEGGDLFFRCPRPSLGLFAPQALFLKSLRQLVVELLAERRDLGHAF